MDRISLENVKFSLRVIVAYQTGDFPAAQADSLGFGKSSSNKINERNSILVIDIIVTTVTAGLLSLINIGSFRCLQRCSLSGYQRPLHIIPHG